MRLWITIKLEMMMMSFRILISYHVDLASVLVHQITIIMIVSIHRKNNQSLLHLIVVFLRFGALHLVLPFSVNTKSEERPSASKTVIVVACHCSSQ